MTRRTRLAVCVTSACALASAAGAAVPDDRAFDPLVWATALPEPGTLALLGLAAICLALFRRRKKPKPPE